MKTAPANLDKDALKASVDLLVDEIVNGDDTWRSFADRLAAERTLGARVGTFKPWSVSNMFSLRAQVGRRKTSVKGLYAGVNQWNKHNRSVLDAELDKPYYIYGPPSFLVRVPNNAANQQANQPNATGAAQPAAVPQPAQQMRRVACAPPLIKVYDWTQTVSLDPDYTEPDWTTPLAGGDLDTYYDLATTAPVQVSATNLSFANQHSWLDASGITVDSSLEPGARIFAMILALAHHHLGHLEQVRTTQRPTYTSEAENATYDAIAGEAALTAYLAMQMLGLDISTPELAKLASSHLKAWVRTDAAGNVFPVEGHKTKRKLVMRRLDVAFKAADSIVAPLLAA